ncbi:MAG: alpha/beta hydrolase, partial [Roseibium sp.]
MSLSEVYQRIARIISDLHHAPVVQQEDMAAHKGASGKPLRYLLLNRAGDVIDANVDDDVRDALLQHLDPVEIFREIPKFYSTATDLIVTTRFHGTGDDCWVVPLSVDDTDEILKEKSSAGGLTPSEVRLLHSLLSGLTIRQSASETGHSYETKRSQLKSLGAKLAVSSQNELIRLTTLWIFNAVQERIAATAQNSKSDADFARSFFSTHYRNQVRYFQISSGERSPIRFAEAGAAGGTPLVLLHGNVLPPLKTSFFEALTQEKIRLILPLRDGFLTNSVEYIPAQQQLENHTRQLDMLLHFLSQKSVDFLAYGTGSAYAMDFAIKHPASVDRLVFAASSYFMSRGQSPVNKFMRNVRKLSIESEHGTHLLIVFYARLLRKERDMLNTLRKAYAQCALDSEILEAFCADPLGRRFFVDGYQASLSSISVDWRMSQRDVWSRFTELGRHAELIHGRDDPLNSFDLVADFVDGNSNVHFTPVQGYGQFLLHDRESPVLKR